jgi:protocatechuate 3,4-dioxygenase beta subunit
MVDARRQESRGSSGRSWLWLTVAIALIAGWVLFGLREGSKGTLPNQPVATGSQAPNDDAALMSPAPIDGARLSADELVAVGATTGREGLASSELNATQEEPPAVTGRVLDAAGLPAAGAEVWLRSGGWYSSLPIEFGPLEAPDNQVLAVCDNDGRFQATKGLEPGASLSVAVTFPGHAVERRLRVPFPRTPRALDDILLEEGRRLRGTVLGQNGGPLPNVAVLLAARRGFMGLEGSFDGIGREVARTDTAGRFEIDCLTPGPWHLYFDAEGYRVEARSGKFGLADIESMKPVRMGKGHSIRGEVVGWPLGPSAERKLTRWVEAIGSGGAEARPRRSLIDAEGSFHIRGVAPAERVTVRLVKAIEGGGYRPTTEAPPQVVPSSATGVQIHFGKQLALEARVVDEAGFPVESYLAFSQLGYFGGTHEIGGEGPGESLDHHPGGELRASGLRLFSREAKPRLLVQASGFFDFDSGELDLEPGASLRLDPVKLAPAPVLRVTVLDSAGMPVEGADVNWVFKDARDLTASTDSRGFATLTALANEPSALTVRASTLKPERRLLPAFEGVDREVSFKLAQGCALHVQLVAPAAPSVAATLRGHRIDAVPLSKDGTPDPAAAMTAHTSRDGLASWRNLGPGRYRVRRVPAAREPQDASVDWLRCPEVLLSPGGPPPTIVLVAPATGSLTGTVTVDGHPLTVATLRLSPTDERNGATGDRDGWRSDYNRVTDAQGRFRFDGVAAGEYTMEIEHDDHAMIARWPVDVQGGVTSVEVQLRLAPVVVTVAREDGSPITGAKVRLIPDSPRYVGHNDGRRAWRDERGDIQQSWFQKELGYGTTDAGGVATFPGCVPRLEGRFSVEPMEGRVAPETRFHVDPLGSEYRILMAPPPKSEAGADAPK